MKGTNRRSSSRRKSSPKSLRYPERGNRQLSSAVTELSERENILRDDVSRILRFALPPPDIV
jgi:hypothetical protein